MAHQRLRDKIPGQSGMGDHDPGNLVPLVYDELRRLAHHYMRGERPDHVLQTTALVNEAYLRLAGLNRMQWRDRTHFFAMAATQMRRILVDHARRHRMAKRSGRWVRVEFDNDLPAAQHGFNVLVIDQLLTRLATFDARKSRVIELRYFGGLSLDETAQVLQISRATVDREWRTARAWLYQQLTDGS